MIDKPIVAVIHMRTQPPGVIHQVTLRPDKMKGLLIRLGETPNDEWNGWVYQADIEIIEKLGIAVQEGNTWKCVPEVENA